MSKPIELLLLETVPNLGIIGDVVKVKPGFARNYLLPFAKAEKPSQERIDELSAVRAEERARLDKLRAEQTTMIEKLAGVELKIERSTNDQGVLYGGVTQHEIAELLREQGYAVEDRYVRVGDQIKRIDTYQIPVVIDKDLRGEVTLIVDSDRDLDLETEDLEIDDEGELVQKAAPKAEDAPAEGDADTPAEAPAEA